MSHVETMNEPATSAEPLTISDAQPAILIDAASQTNVEEKENAVNVCKAGNGWCKNTTKEGQTVCDECTKMMDSYP